MSRLVFAERIIVEPRANASAVKLRFFPLAETVKRKYLGDASQFLTIQGSVLKK